MSPISGKILKSQGWPDGKVIGLARNAGNELLELGLEATEVLARLEAVRANPGPFLADPLLASLARDAYLEERGITLLGGGLDESPQAYKPIDAVIAAQVDLVDVLGKFTPRVVRMADDASDR